MITGMNVNKCSYAKFRAPTCSDDTKPGAGTYLHYDHTREAKSVSAYNPEFVLM